MSMKMYFRSKFYTVSHVGTKNSFWESVKEGLEAAKWLRSERWVIVYIP
jgi:hypothetical protein